jgi:hypothetical protein
MVALAARWLDVQYKLDSALMSVYISVICCNPVLKVLNLTHPSVSVTDGLLHWI